MRTGPKKPYVYIAVVAALLVMFGLLRHSPWVAGDLAPDNARLDRHTKRDKYDEEEFNLNRRTEKSKSLRFTDPDSPKIKAIIDELNKLEQKRMTYCREYESKDRIVHEFLMKKPSEAEMSVIKDLVSRAKGMTVSRDGPPVSWSQELRNRYLLPIEFEQYIVSVEFTKSDSTGSYSILGVPEGQLIMREGVAPMTANGQIHVVAMGIPFDFASNWRFSSLVKMDDGEAGGSK